MKVAPSGSVDASVGLMGSGQGHETAFAQAVAAGLGVKAEVVRMQLGNTDIAPYGMGSRGARGGTVGRFRAVPGRADVATERSAPSRPRCSG